MLNRVGQKYPIIASLAIPKFGSNAKLNRVAQKMSVNRVAQKMSVNRVAQKYRIIASLAIPKFGSNASLNRVDRQNTPKSRRHFLSCSRVDTIQPRKGVI